MAHIERRGQRKYRARYRGPDGRERSRTFATRRDAEAWLAAAETRKARGEWIDPTLARRTFEDYAAEWMATKAAVSARTLLNVQGRLANYGVPFFGSMRLGSVRPMHARAFVADLAGRGLAPATVKAIVLTVGQVFTQAALDGLIARSPFAGVELPADRHREEMHFLDAGQVNDLGAAIDDRYRCAVYVAAYGGLRAGEVWALRPERVNVLARTVEIVESMSEVPGRGIIVGPTKTGKVRTITVPRFLTEMVGEHIGRYPSSDGYLFSAAEGGPVRHRNFTRRHFKPAVVAAGLPPGLRWHDLRHTCAALLIAAGRHIEEVKDYLGHSSIRVTSDRYGHLFPRAREEMAAALDATYSAANAAQLAAYPRPGGSVRALSDASRGPRKGL